MNQQRTFLVFEKVDMKKENIYCVPSNSLDK